MMNRTILRFLSVFCLFVAIAMVSVPLRAMNTVTQNTTPALYTDGDIRVTQQDLDHFEARTLTKQRFDELLPTLSDLLENEPTDYDYIGNLTHTTYQYSWNNWKTGQAARKIKEKINRLSKSIFYKTVVQKHPGHTSRPLKTTASTGTTTTTTRTNQPTHSSSSASSSSASSSTPAPVAQDTTPVLYTDGDIRVTQQDLDHFAARTMSKERFEELLPTLSDLIQDCARDEKYSDYNYMQGGYYHIAHWDYAYYTSNNGYYHGYADGQRREIAKKIKQKTTQLSKSIFFKTVAQKHPGHKNRQPKTTATTATTSTTAQTGTPSAQSAQNIVFQDKKVAITLDDVHAFNNGTLDAERFDTIAPVLAEHASELDGKNYDDYLDMVRLEPEQLTDITQQLKSEFESLAAQHAEAQAEDHQAALHTSLINTITQADIDAFEYGELTQQRFDALQNILQSETGSVSPITYDQYQQMGSFQAQAVMAAAEISRTEITKEFVMQLNMLGANVSMPKPRPTLFSTFGAALYSMGYVTVEAMAGLITGKNFYKERQEQYLKEEEARIQEAAQDEALDNIAAKADQLLEKYTDDYIDTLIDQTNPLKIVHDIEQAKKQTIKNQNCMIAGGLMPERIDFAGLNMDIGKDMPYPIALYKKDLVYGAGFATKACIAYWTISQVSKYRAQYIYKNVLEHTDEFITLLKELRTSEQEPKQPRERRSWKQYARDKISGKGNDSTPLYNLKQHLDTHHQYIGYNPFKFPLLGHLGLLLFSKAGIAHAYDSLIIHDDSCEESRSAYYKGEDGRFKKLPGTYSPISVTQAAQSLSLAGLWSTATSKIPQTVRRAIPIPLSKRELLQGIEHHTPKNVLTFLKSNTVAYLGLFASSVFEIKFMNNLYHARWHQWVRAHQDYLIDLLERYQQVRTLPENDATRVQFEQEILLSIQEGNALSGFNRATVWNGIMRTAINRVTLACMAPIIAYALWHNKKALGLLGLAATKALGGYISDGVRMLPLVAQLGAGAAVYTWHNPRDAAGALIGIPVELTIISAQIAFEVAKAAAATVAVATIVTGATIAQNETVQKYGKMALEAGAVCIDVSKWVGHASMNIGKKITRRFNF